MPVLSAHCFANRKGGVGKSTLCYQIAAQYAAGHPDVNVLVADFTEAGDVSEILLGGMHEDRGRKALVQLVTLSNVTHLCLKALAASVRLSVDHEAQSITRKDDGSGSAPETSFYERVLEHMPKRRRTKLDAGYRDQDVVLRSEGDVDGSRSEGSVDISEFAIPVHPVNEWIPSNLYLCPSGVEFEPLIRFSKSQQRRIISVLRRSFEEANGDWKVFMDTDQDEVYTELALGISHFCILPLHADISEWLRAKTTLRVLRNLREELDCVCTLQMIVWNKLSVQSNRESPCIGTQKCSFTPTKAEQDLLRSLHSLVHEEAKQHPEDFFNFGREEGTASPFKPAVCMRNLSVVGLASKDMGVPIPVLHAGMFHGVNMTYNLSQYSVNSCRANLCLLVEAIDAGDELLKLQQGGSLSEARMPLNGKGSKEPADGIVTLERIPHPAAEVFNPQTSQGPPDEGAHPEGDEDVDEQQLEEPVTDASAEQGADPVADAGRESGQEEPAPREPAAKMLNDADQKPEPRPVQSRARRPSRKSRGSQVVQRVQRYSLRNLYSLRSRSCGKSFSLHSDGRPWLRN